MTHRAAGLSPGPVARVVAGSAMTGSASTPNVNQTGMDAAGHGVGVGWSSLAKRFDEPMLSDLLQILHSVQRVLELAIAPETHTASAPPATDTE